MFNRFPSFIPFIPKKITYFVLENDIKRTYKIHQVPAQEEIQG